MSNPLFSTDTYAVVIAKNDNDTACYHVVNRITGVIESETQILPMAISFAQQFDSHLEELRSGEATTKTPIKPSPLTAIN